MKYAFETHDFAPELNRVIRVLRNKTQVSIRAPGMTSLKAYRACTRPLEAFRHAIVTTLYDDPKDKWLQRTYSGRIIGYREALQFADGIRKTLAPGGRVKVRTTLIGG